MLVRKDSTRSVTDEGELGIELGTSISPEDFDAILDETFHAGAQEHNPQEAYLVQQTANRVFEELELLEVGPQEPSCLCTDLKGTEPFAAGLQELQLEQTQLCLHEANMQIEDLTLELERSARTQAEQYSKLTRQLEYTTRDMRREEKAADAAQAKLYEQETNMQAQMREMRSHLQAQQAQTTVLQQALEAAKAQHAQDTLSMQLEQEKADEAKGFLEDAYAAIDALEQQVDRLSKKMRKVATGLHQAINPNHQGKLHWARTLRTAKHQVAKMRLLLEEAQSQCSEGQQMHARVPYSLTMRCLQQERHVSQGLQCQIADLTQQLSCLQLANAEQQQQEADREQSSAEDISYLNAELDDSLRAQAEQHSTFSRRLELMERDLKSEEKAFGEAQWKLRQHEHKMAAQASKIAQLEQELQQAQSKAGGVEHLQSVSAYQGGELMKLQQEVYHLRALLSSQGINPALASGPLVSPWSQASTPAHLRDTSSPSPSSALEFGSQSLKGSPALLCSQSPASGAKTVTHPSEHGHDSQLQSSPLSGSPVTGLCQANPCCPRVCVRTTVKQKARQEAVVAKLATTPAATPTQTPTGPGGLAAIRRRLDASPGSAARSGASPARSSSTGGRALLSTGRRRSPAGSRMSSLANCCSYADKENSPCATGKMQTPAGSGASKQSLRSRAAFSFGSPAGRSPLTPLTGAVNATPAMTPHPPQLIMVAAGAVPAVPGQAALPIPPSVRLQVPRIPNTSTATASRSSPLCGSDSVLSSQQGSAVRKAAVSHHDAASAITDVSGAGAARSRGRQRRTATAAAPAASRMVTRSQAAAQKHVQRMQSRSQPSQ
ncbi:hypothetical protein ABBQ38_007457 [Trebouxia sp. C0009 RCD-2024]